MQHKGSSQRRKQACPCCWTHSAAWQQTRPMRTMDKTLSLQHHNVCPATNNATAVAAVTRPHSRHERLKRTAARARARTWRTRSHRKRG